MPPAALEDLVPAPAEPPTIVTAGWPPTAAGWPGRRPRPLRHRGGACRAQHPLRLLTNFFFPQVKLIAKTRDGAKVRRRYDIATTALPAPARPPRLPVAAKTELAASHARLNPPSCASSSARRAAPRTAEPPHLTEAPNAAHFRSRARLTGDVARRCPKFGAPDVGPTPAPRKSDEPPEPARWPCRTSTVSRSFT